MRFLKILFICMLYFISQILYAQKEAIFWYFGLNEGLDFHYLPPREIFGSTHALGECSTMSDKFGNLLFYTDGQNVLNKYHSGMKNGNGLHAKSSSYESTQGVIIVPRPGNKFQYYIFTSEPVKPYRFEYSIVDMSKQNGLGEVIVKNIVLIDSVCEKVTAVKHSDERSIWVVTHKWNSDAYYSFKISGSGVNSSPVISHSGKKISNNSPWTKTGYMKISPDGKWIVTANNRINLDLSKFNPTTGIVTYYCGFYQDSLNCSNYFCMEFSPDISKLYYNMDIGNNMGIWQIDINAGDTNAVKNSLLCIVNDFAILGACQIGIDKKIYFSNQRNNLSVINRPNLKGKLCDYIENYTNTFTIAMGYGLNNYLQSYFFNPDIKANYLCFHDSTRFGLSDTLGIDSVHWSFDNNSTGLANFSNIKNPFHIFSDTGLYHVRAIAFHNTLTDTSYRDIYISYYPVASFTVIDTFQCLKGNKFTFTDSSTIIKGKLDLEWDFGDSTLDFIQKPIHNFLKAGNYSVKLTVLSDYGCSASKTKIVYVYPMPSVDITFNDSVECYTGNKFTLSNNWQSAGGIRKWDLGDGITDTAQNVQHSYMVPDSYLVKLFCTTDKGCKDSSNKLIIVNPSPVASFSINDSIQCLNTNSFSFNYKPSVYNDKIIWDFGDGITDTINNPLHKYLTSGTFIVKLNVSNQFGCKDSIQKVVIVNPNPKTNFTVNDSDQCLKKNHFILNNLSILNSVSGNWQWSFGDGVKDTNKNTSHIYLNDNLYNIKLIATNQFNCKDSVEKSVIILPSPDAGFNINDSTQCFNQNQFVFTIIKNQANSNFNWSFGDGTSNVFKDTVNHSYLSTGNFNVKLLLVNTDQCKDSSQLTIIVYPSPDATFTINNSSQCLKGNLFAFTSKNQPVMSSFDWDFGDINTSTATNPTHSYINSGNFNVLLIVTSKDNCDDTTSQIIIVKPNPVTPVASNSSPVCESKTLSFYVFSTPNSNFEWKADNGFTSNLQNPVIKNAGLNDSGIYYVRAFLNGCESDSAITHVIIYPEPIVTIGKDNTICQGDHVILDPGYFASYLWQDSSTKRVFTVNKPGTYSVLVKNTYGCKDSDEVIFKEKCPPRIFIPDAFTPNGDGLNDKFEIITSDLMHFEIRIFDHWGENIFNSTDPSISWDGTYKGTNCLVGTYTYMIYTTDNDAIIRNFQGIVNLLR